MPIRPQKMDVYYNRRANQTLYDRQYKKGWKYLQPKSLDLTPEDNFQALGCFRKPVSIVNKVNLNRELPAFIDHSKSKESYDDNDSTEELVIDPENPDAPPKKQKKKKEAPVYDDIDIMELWAYI